MANEIKCPNCGAMNADDAKLCAHCGKPLTGVEAQRDAGAAMETLEHYYDSHDHSGTADDLLGAYAEDMLRRMSGGKALVHRSAAKKQLLAWGLFALVAFLDISGMMFYHRNYLVFVAILAAAVIALLATRKKVGNRAALLRKMAAMPDADISGVLMSEHDSMVSELLVTALKGIILAVLIAALVLLYSKPHMIFENNATGCGLRFYTAALSMPGDVVIPETHKGKPVTEIRGNVFQNLSAIRTVKLPSGITQIRGSTFENCRGLVSIDIPEGVTRIGGHAFCDCDSLSRVTVPSTVREIGSSAFRRCPNLRNIRIPEGCSVNAKAFKESYTKVEKY